jgi:hypothetical protein
MTSVPFAPGVRRGVAVHDRAMAGGSLEARASAVEQVVSPGLFRALGVTLLAGRVFGSQDQPGSPLVAIVSESLARSLWANADAIGRVLEFDGHYHEVVGVVRDIRGSDGTARGGGLDREPQPVLYLSSAQFPQSTISLVIRSDATVQATLPAIRAAVREIEPTLPIPDLRRLDEWIAAAGGIVLGLLGAWSISRLITSLLFDVSATDPFTFALTAFGVTGVAALACTVPALRATRIDPVIALRGD